FCENRPGKKEQTEDWIKHSRLFEPKPKQFRNPYTNCHCIRSSIVPSRDCSLRQGWESKMRRRQFFATIVLGKCVLIREGIVRILRGANFRTLTSVSCADDLPPSSFQSHQLLVLIVHTGDEFDSVVEQIGFLKDRNPKARIAVVADHYRLGDMVSAFRAGAN